MKLKRWRVGIRAERSVVEAVDQHAAWNTLRGRPLSDFGLIVTALEVGKADDEAVGVHTTALLLTWGRDEEARWLLDALRDAGVDDETDDIAYAFAHGRTAPFIASSDSPTAP